VTGIVILTGAGISRESGLSTFRDPDGIWAQVRIEDVATPEAFSREPSAGSALFDEAHHGPATQVVPAFVERLLLATYRVA
jgi:NAD-dependent deacetylase